MARKGKLLAALDIHKGRDFKLERQKRLQKQAEKKRKSKVIAKEGQPTATDEEEDAGAVAQSNRTHVDGESDEWASDESEAALPEHVCAPQFSNLHILKVSR